jgi:tryptophan synthase alpha chain
VAVGFGITTPAQAKAIAAGADAVVVGSALVNAIRARLAPGNKATGKTVSSVLDLVKSLSQALRRA